MVQTEVCIIKYTVVHLRVRVASLQRRYNDATRIIGCTISYQNSIEKNNTLLKAQTMQKNSYLTFK